MPSRVVFTGFFTLSTLEAIHSDHESSVSSTPSSSSSQNDKRTTDLVKRCSYQTPARPRLDSEVFRRTIGEVTCEKLVNSNEDVSPIESEDGGFNLSIGSTANMKSTSLTSLFGGIEVKKKLEYENDGKYVDGDVLDSQVKTLQGPLFPEFDKAIESIHSLVFGSQSSPHYEEQRQNSQLSQPILHPKARTLRPQLFLRQSVTFIKALRKTGRIGKVLIQGWVAFRQNVSWREVTLNTRRCDFRYIILLDDMPILHIFMSQKRRRNEDPKSNPFASCMSLDLTQDIEVAVGLASKELGHEVYLVEADSNKLICSMLPVAMKNEVFLDKHRSRLTKGNALGNIFPRSHVPAVTFQDKKAHVAIEQNDTARHLLFVLSAAITFPPPHET